MVVDSAIGLQSKNFLIKSGQEDPTSQGATEFKAARAVLLNWQATSPRHLSEHEMRMIQGRFPRLEDDSQLEEFGKRQVASHLMVSPHNCHASKVRIDKIMDAFMSRTEGFCSHSVLEDANNCFDWL